MSLVCEGGKVSGVLLDQKWLKWFFKVRVFNANMYEEWYGGCRVREEEVGVEG